MQIEIALIVFAVIFISELPDKSLFATLLLSRKYPAKLVWLGAASAFLVHVIIAVTAGRLFSLLPHRPLAACIASLFLLGAILLFLGRSNIEPESTQIAVQIPSSHSVQRIYITAFSVTFLGELGDITQITTANYAAHYHDPWSVGIGSLLALWAVTGLAVTYGRRILVIIPPRLLQRVSGCILLGFAIVSASQAIR
jgi:putative Ca2+/H+ antiporter (TMEM165/GDT1 family)